MKILQVVHSFLPDNFSGTEVYTYKLSKTLQNMGHEVSVFFRRNDPGQNEFNLVPGVYEGIPTFALNHTFNRSLSFQDTYLNKNIDTVFGSLLDSLKPDIVHIQHLLFLSLGIIKEARKRGIPVVFTINDYWLFCPKGQFLTEQLQVCDGSNQEACVSCVKPQFLIRKHAMFYYNLLRSHGPLWLLRFIKIIYFHLMESRPGIKKSFPDLIAQRSSAVKEAISQINLFIAPSEFARDLFLDKDVSRDKVVTCRHGITGPVLPFERKKDEKTIRFGYVGTLLPMKGVDLLIKVFRKAPSPDARLLIYGKAKAYAGYEAFYKELREEAKNDQRITFMGDFDNSDIGKVLSNIDVLVVPSIWPENAPLIILEALAFKVPVVASRVGGIPELIRDGENGFLFMPEDKEDLKKKLNDILMVPGILGKLRENIGPVKSINENVAEIESIYKRLKGKL